MLRKAKTDGQSICRGPLKRDVHFSCLLYYLSAAATAVRPAVYLNIFPLQPLLFAHVEFVAGTVLDKVDVAHVTLLDVHHLQNGGY